MSESQLTPVEQHLGDRLAALVDGELGHDARERVLAHLATCPRCKAEADAQRRLKSVFAETAPPPPSESLLARLQGLPGGSDRDGGPFGGTGHGGAGLFPISMEYPPKPLGTDSRPAFRYAPEGPHASVLPGGERGFRIHDVGRSESERSASRSRRFAFAAAGAMSLAAIALGGVSTGATVASGNPVGGSPSNATPMRAASPTPAVDAVRRRTGDPVVARSEGARETLPVPAAPVVATAPERPEFAPPRTPASLTDALPVTSSGLLPFAPLISPLPVSASTPDAGTTADGPAWPTSGQAQHIAPRAPVASTAPAGGTGARVR